MVILKKKISFSVGGQQLVGTLQYPQEIKQDAPAVLFLHGWTSSEKKYIERAKPLVESGFVCLTFDMRGHGNSEGDLQHLTRQDHLNDCVAAYDFLGAQKWVDSNRIGVVGSSYGGYMGALLTSKRTVKWLVLKSPANYEDKGISDPQPPQARSWELSFWRGKKTLPTENRALMALYRYKEQVLIIEAEKDEKVPRQTLLNYKNAHSDQSKVDYLVMKGADHSSSREEWNHEFIQLVKNWFLKKLTSLPQDQS